MKRAFFTGKHRNGEYSAIDVQPWVDKMIAKNAFGKPDRWELHEEPPVGYTDSRVVEDGVEYFYPAEYSYTIEDITVEHAEKEQRKLDREAAHDWLKTNKGNIMSLPELNEAFYKLLESLGY